jgi:hypothetical protein
MRRILALALVLGLAVSFLLTGDIRAQDETATSKEKAISEEKVSEAEGAEEVTQQDLLETLTTVHGKHARRLFRAAYWAAGLEGDMKAVYDAHGYPSSRYREQKLGRVEEKWTYMELGKQFTFRDGKLVGEKDFNPGSLSVFSLK